MTFEEKICASHSERKYGTWQTRKAVQDTSIFCLTGHISNGMAIFFMCTCTSPQLSFLSYV